MDNKKKTPVQKLIIDLHKNNLLKIPENKVLINLIIQEALRYEHTEIIHSFCVGRGFETIPDYTNTNEPYNFTKEDEELSDESIEFGLLYYNSIYITWDDETRL